MLYYRYSAARKTKNTTGYCLHITKDVVMKTESCNKCVDSKKENTEAKIAESNASFLVNDEIHIAEIPVIDTVIRCTQITFARTMPYALACLGNHAASDANPLNVLILRSRFAEGAFRRSKAGVVRMIFGNIVCQCQHVADTPYYVVNYKT